MLRKRMNGFRFPNYDTLFPFFIFCFVAASGTRQRYAESMLGLQAERFGFGAVDTIYAIGDNPKSDILGANNAGTEALTE